MTRRKLLIVVDDNRMFAVHAYRLLTGAMEFGFNKKSSLAPFERVSPDGMLKVLWHRPSEGALESYRHRVRTESDEVWSIIDVRGVFAEGTDPGFRGYHDAFVEAAGGGNAARARVWVMSSYGRSAWGVEPVVRPKTIDSLRALRDAMSAEPEDERPAPTVTHGTELRILVTGAGFELKERSQEGIGVGCPPTGELLRQMRPNGLELKFYETGTWPVPQTCDIPDLWNAAQAGKLDEYWDALLMDFNRLGEAAHAQELAYREAFRRAFLAHDVGHQAQALAAAELDWDFWLTTNYTRFADRAIDLVTDLAKGARAWHAITTKLEAEAIERLLDAPWPLRFGHIVAPQYASRVLIKLHGDIGHVWTMAIAGMDKTNSVRNNFGVKPELHRMYSVAEAMIQNALGRRPIEQCTWHIVGHALKDKTLLRLMAKVIARSEARHRLILVAPQDGASPFDAAEAAETAVTSLKSRLREADPTDAEQLKVAGRLVRREAGVNGVSVSVSVVPSTALDYLTQLNARGFDQDLDLPEFRPYTMPQAQDAHHAVSTVVDRWSRKSALSALVDQPARLLVNSTPEFAGRGSPSIPKAGRPEDPPEAPPHGPPVAPPLGPPVDTTPPDREIIVTGHDDKSGGEPRSQFEPATRYRLRFQVGPGTPFNLASGNVGVSRVATEGLLTRWSITSEHIEYLRISRGKCLFEDGSYQAAFDLLIPESGPSEAVDLNVYTPDASLNWILSVVIMVGVDVYRTLTVDLQKGTRAERDRICVDARHLDLEPPHEWMTPPIEITIFVHENGEAFVQSRGGYMDYAGRYRWPAKAKDLAGPIEAVRRHLERFRSLHTNYLNDLDPETIAAELAKEDWKPYDVQSILGNPEGGAGAAAALSSNELRALAVEGFRLFEEVFPDSTPLRKMIERLEPGTRINIYWTREISHVPWQLMYLAPLNPTRQEPVDCAWFLGFRFRLADRPFESAGEPQATSRALGTLDASFGLHLLFWGRELAIQKEAEWQRDRFGKWANQQIYPTGNGDRREEIVRVLHSPEPRPAALLYLYCQFEAGSGNDPELFFGDGPSDVLRSPDLSSARLVDAPLVFANACLTAAANPLTTSELERRFFRRGARSFIGTETKVPVGLASRFAWLFFEFFYRRVAPEPVGAGEALSQARWFLFNRFSNIGGLFYAQANGYDLMLASSDEVMRLRRS